jgi:dTDP-4-dehydrorhamnose reductase
MSLIFTGMNGTVAPAVAKAFQEHGEEIVAFDRQVVAIDDVAQMTSFIKSVQPEAVFHFATGPIEWAKELATITKQLNIPFVYISTISVFDGKVTPAPYYPDTPTSATDDFGKYKADSEQAVLQIYPQASIYRLSWQITDDVTSNGMLRFLKEQMDRQGEVRASRSYFPSAAFLTDTADAVYDAYQNLPPGIYNFNSNDDVSFYDIIEYLATKYPWIIVTDKAKFARDHRMLDERVSIKKLRDYL